MGREIESEGEKEQKGERWVERGREKKRETDVRASMTGRDNLIIILMWDVMNNSHWTDNTHSHAHKQIHTQPRTQTDTHTTTHTNRYTPVLFSHFPWFRDTNHHHHHQQRGQRSVHQHSLHGATHYHVCIHQCH